MFAYRPGGFKRAIGGWGASIPRRSLQTSAMATTEWTDQRLNDSFEALRRDIADLTIEMREMRAEMNAGFRSLWMTMVGANITLMVAFVGALVATQA